MAFTHFMNIYYTWVIPVKDKEKQKTGFVLPSPHRFKKKEIFTVPQESIQIFFSYHFCTGVDPEIFNKKYIYILIALV